MPTLKIPDGEIYYEVNGSGYPVMIFNPGGCARSFRSGGTACRTVGSRGLDAPDG